MICRGSPLMSGVTPLAYDTAGGRLASMCIPSIELTNATSAVDADYRYGYDFDDIGNRKTSSERGTNSVYTASQLNQYTAVDDFTPTYDADGNETLVKTATGIWQVTYNGENRPVRWELVSPDSNTPNSNTQTLLRMSFDRMDRRVTKNDQRFVYNGYLQIANHHSSTSTSHFNYYIWDCTESVATRPLVWNFSTTQPSTSLLLFYTHDGNKNVSEVIASDSSLAAHYEYAPFGALTVSRGTSAAVNPFRFSSEYADDELGLVYYNYRHYDPAMGRWLQRDPIEEVSGIRLYGYTGNGMQVDFLGLWKALDSGNARRKYKRYLGDTNSELADEVGLDVGEFELWARLIDPDECISSVPNVWIDADLLQGPAELYDHVINIGGTLGSFALTDIGVWGKKIVKVDDIASLQAALAGSVGDLWGIQVFAHGDSSGTFVVMPGKDRRFIEQNEIMSYVSGGGYKIAYAYMMQCYSAAGEYGDRWRDLAIHFIGYDGMNVLGFDMEGDYWPWNWFD